MSEKRLKLLAVLGFILIVFPIKIQAPITINFGSFHATFLLFNYPFELGVLLLLWVFLSVFWKKRDVLESEDYIFSVDE